jgi:transposase
MQQHGLTPGSPPPTTVEHLPDDPATLKQMILELLSTLHQQQGDLAALRHRIDLLLRRLYGPRQERVDPNQLLLFTAATAAADTTAPATPAAVPASPRRCRPHGRRRLPDNLPRQCCHHELPEAERLCPRCGQVRADIGTERSEQLDYRPASLFVIEHHVHKYTCPCLQQQASAPEGMASPAQEPAAMSSLPPESSPASAAAPVGAEATPPGNADSNTPAAVDEASMPRAATASPQAVAVVIAAAKPLMPIAKGLPGPGLLAHLIVSKYVDHLPLHRLERVYERQGRFLPRSTLADWLASCASLLRPLYDLMVAIALQSRALHTDDTTVKMQLQELRTHFLHTARLWVYLGDNAHPYNVFDFTQTRKRDGPQQFLKNYQGYLHADAFSGYDGLYLPVPGTGAARILEVACNAHARRKFYEARGSDLLRSHQALAYYRQLYALERPAKDFSEEQRLQMRKDLAVPILARFHQWLVEQREAVLPKSPMAEAVGYALNNWSALIRYTEAGFLAIDNNVSEREMKRVAIGRKNWLFVGSPHGGQTAAVLLSFTSTCQRLGVEPWAYLQDVLRRLPTLPASSLAELLPDRWQAARTASVASSPEDESGPSNPSLL